MFFEGDENTNCSAKHTCYFSRSRNTILIIYTKA